MLQIKELQLFIMQVTNKAKYMTRKFELHMRKLCRVLLVLCMRVLYKLAAAHIIDPPRNESGLCLCDVDVLRGYTL